MSEEQNLIYMPKELFQEIHNVLSQLPYYQVRPLMDKIIQSVKVEDAKED